MTTFSYGDVLELVALACFVVAAFLALNLIGGLLASGVCLFYEAQDFSTLMPTLPTIKLSRRFKRTSP